MIPAEVSPAVLTFAGVALVAVCGLVGTLGASWISNRANERQKAAQALIDEKKVDREEFDSIRAELRLQMSDLRTDLAAEREARERSDERAGAAEQRAKRAEQRTTEVEQQGKRLARRLSRSERRVLQLEEALAAANVPVPPPAADPLDL